MGTLVLKPTAIYAAYLAGYLDASPSDIFDAHAFDEPGPPAGMLERMAAYASGIHDGRSGSQEALGMREVLAVVQSMLSDEPITAD